MKKVLIADKADAICEKVLRERGLEPVVKTGMKPEELKACIAEFDAIIVRSATTLTCDLLQAAAKLKAVARFVGNIRPVIARSFPILIFSRLEKFAGMFPYRYNTKPRGGFLCSRTPEGCRNCSGGRSTIC